MAMLQEFLTAHNEEIIGRCRDKVAERRFPPEAENGLLKGVPLFLAQLTESLGANPGSSAQMVQSAAEYGKELERLGFTLDQVVHVYGNVCQSVTDLAVELKAPISNDDFRVLNRCLDDAIADAVVGFGGLHDKEISDEDDLRSDERLAAYVDQEEPLLAMAIAAFEALKGGTVGIGGSTGGALERSLSGLRALLGRSLGELRLTAHTLNPTSVPDEYGAVNPVEQPSEDRSKAK
jgi:hypothetical protein